jgi:hypothetical protein
MSRNDDQDERDATNRMKTLVRLLAYARANRIDGTELMNQVAQLGLELELAELAGGDRKRHRRIAAARAAAGLAELEEAVADLTVGLGEVGNV